MQVRKGGIKKNVSKILSPSSDSRQLFSRPVQLVYTAHTLAKNHCDTKPPCICESWPDNNKEWLSVTLRSICWHGGFLSQWLFAFLPKDNNCRGLIPQLLQRLAMLRYLGRVTSQEKMKSLIPGILISKISYALPLIGSIWGFGGYRSQEPMKLCFTKNDLQRIQSIQRQAALLMLPTSIGIDHRLTESVLRDVGWISVHQMIALSTLTLFMRIIKYGTPEGILQELIVSRDSRSARGLYRTKRYNLNISLENFINQAVRLYNTLPANIRSMEYGDTLRCELRRWVAAKVKIKPWVSHGIVCSNYHNSQ